MMENAKAETLYRISEITFYKRAHVTERSCSLADPDMGSCFMKSKESVSVFDKTGVATAVLFNSLSLVSKGFSGLLGFSVDGVEQCAVTVFDNGHGL